MRCLNLFLNKDIEAYEQKTEFTRGDYDVKVVCHTKAWNRNQKITSVVLGILTGLLVATGIALYATSCLSIGASMGIVGAGVALLLADVAFVLLQLHKRKPFMEMVGEIVNGKAVSDGGPTLETLKTVTYGKTKWMLLNTERQFREYLISRFDATTFWVEYFESQSLYDSREKQLGKDNII